MSAASMSEDEYYATIDANLTEIDHETVPAYDHVSSHEEFFRFQKALLRWLADKADEWDQQAIDEEHGTA